MRSNLIVVFRSKFQEYAIDTPESVKLTFFEMVINKLNASADKLGDAGTKFFAVSDICCCTSSAGFCRSKPRECERW